MDHPLTQTTTGTQRTSYIEGVVMSVPHSGTRTLVEHIGMTPEAQGMQGGRWWHFGYHDQLLKQYYGTHLHVPVRHPLDVVHSWVRQSKNIERLVKSYESMFKALETTEHTLHKVEDIPRLAGTQDFPHLQADPTALRKAEDTILYRVVSPHMDWFTAFYGINKG